MKYMVLHNKESIICTIYRH